MAEAGDPLRASEFCPRAFFGLSGSLSRELDYAGETRIPVDAPNGFN